MGYLSDEEFYLIYSKVPRLTLDLLIQSEKGTLLSLRSIEPYLGEWHMPGGTVYKEETVEEAATRIAKRETGLTVRMKKSIGHMEFPNEMRIGNNIHTISIVVFVEIIAGELQHDEGAQELDWFINIPENTILQHKLFLINLKSSLKQN